MLRETRFSATRRWEAEQAGATGQPVMVVGHGAPAGPGQGEPAIVADTLTLGIPQLDHIWTRLPDGAKVLLANEPGVEGIPFLLQTLHHRLTAGDEVVYVVTDRPPSRVPVAANALGLSLDGLVDRLHFIDAHGPLFGLPEPGATPVGSLDGLAAWVEALETAAEGRDRPTLLFEGLSTMLDRVGIEDLLARRDRFLKALGRYRLTVASFTHWPYVENIDTVAGSFDAVVALKAVQERVVTSQYFAVPRADWVNDLDDNPRLYRIMRPGGVVVYVPKLVVTGPFNAGKSSFVRSVAEDAVCVDRMGTTVALDHGRVAIDGVVADIFGTPGQSRFDPILQVVAGQALGVVLMVDSTKPASFARARAMLESTWKVGVPAIVAANKQDVDGALSPQEVATALQVRSPIPVIGCVAEDPESARTVIRRLIDQVMRAGPGRAAFSGNGSTAEQGPAFDHGSDTTMAAADAAAGREEQ